MNVASGSDASHELRIGHRLHRGTLRRRFMQSTHRSPPLLQKGVISIQIATQRRRLLARCMP